MDVFNTAIIVWKKIRNDYWLLHTTNFDFFYVQLTAYNEKYI